jgi:hypothetical protein
MAENKIHKIRRIMMKNLGAATLTNMTQTDGVAVSQAVEEND